MSKSNVILARFGARVKTLPARRGIALVDFEAASKLPRRRIESILAGNYRCLTIRDMDVIANVLGTSLDILLAPDEAIELDRGSNGTGSNGSFPDSERGGRQDI